MDLNNIIGLFYYSVQLIQMKNQKLKRGQSQANLLPQSKIGFQRMDFQDFKIVDDEISSLRLEEQEIQKSPNVIFKTKSVYDGSIPLSSLQIEDIQDGFLEIDDEKSFKTEDSFQINDISYISQMDDFMIDQRQSQAEDISLLEEFATRQNTKYIQEEISDHVTEEQIQQFQADFYNEKYFAYEMKKTKDAIFNRVWNTQFDCTNDIVFVVMAKVKIVESTSVRELSERTKLSHEQQFEVYQTCCVELKLMLEIWNIDDRVILDKSHTKRPYSQKLILKVQENFDEPIYQAYIMTFLQKKYQKFSALHFVDRDILYFQSQNSIVRYNISQNRKIVTATMNLNDCESGYTTFQTYVQNGDQNKNFEKVIIFLYKQSLIDGKPHQELEIKSTDFSDKRQGYKTTKVLQQQHDRIQFNDDNIFNYFDSEFSYKLLEPFNKLLEPFDVQRIKNSNTFILLFPSGTLFMIGISPIQIQAKIQLDLKDDDVIIDKSYCVSENGKNHCFWLLDSKQQVWKCSNEREANNSNWIMIKIKILSSMLTFQRFMQPAMTYHEYYLTSNLNGISCIKEITSKVHKDQMALLSYNSTSTKLVMVIQPNFMEIDISHAQGNQNKNELPKDQMVIKMYCFAKKQQMILNNIAQKQPQESPEFNKFSNQPNSQNLIHRFKQQISKLIVTKYEENDEILEMQYMGKIQVYNKTQKVRYMRQFLIRKKKKLELMITNGLTFQVMAIDTSNCEANYEISDIMLSDDNSILLAYYSQESNNKKFYVQQFQYSPQNYSFQKIKKIQHTANLTIRGNGSMFEIQISFLKKGLSGSRTNFQQQIQVKKSRKKIHIMIPIEIIHPQLLNDENEFKRFIISCNSRVLMCGRVIIHLNSKFDNVSDIGCLINVKIKSFQNFQFQSLFVESERKYLLEKCQKLESLQNIVNFDVQFLQVSSMDTPNIMYLNCRMIDANKSNEETTIIKLDCNTLHCVEVYQSKFKIIHIAIVESKEIHLSDQDSKSEFEASLEGGLISKKENNQDAMVILDMSDIMPNINPKSKDQILKKHDRHDFSKNEGDCSKFDHDHEINISLISQTQKQINIEIIQDLQFQKAEETSDKHRFIISEIDSSIRNVDLAKLVHQNSIQNKQKARLIYFINIISKNDLMVKSEIGWISKEKMILTINNRYHLLNLSQYEMIGVKHGIYYGMQQVNADLFVSIVNKFNKFGNLMNDVKDHHHHHHNESIKKSPNTSQVTTHTHQQESDHQNEVILVSQDSIKRMEISSFSRYAQLYNRNKRTDFNKTLDFFTPCEELAGGSVFSLLSFHLDIIQPYIDKVDEKFIDIMNRRIKNIIHYTYSLSQSSETNKYRVHMYQDDISGDNAIERAFRKNSIFCIQSFVESLLQLSSHDIQFRNCFDKALLMMIKRNINVKDLINSELFYPQIFLHHSIFSANQNPMIEPYFYEMRDLEYENPIELFDKDENKNLISSKIRTFLKSHVEKYIQAYRTNHYLDPRLSGSSSQHEMQFNYLRMDKIQGHDKIQLTRSLMKSSDLGIFEQEAIQMIIDFKWNTYAKKFFFLKFYIYCIFIISFYVNLASLNSRYQYPPHVFYEEGRRNKNAWFLLRKVIGMSIQFFFMSYEFVQFYQEGQEYWHDLWNIFELLAIFFYFWGSVLDLMEDRVSDLLRIVNSITVLLSLVKVLYLIRVFKNLSFLVMMVIQVIKDLRYFLVIFTIFIFTFAQIFYIVQVDITYYGRMPTMMALFIACIRTSMGDFSIIDPYVGFDPFDTIVDENGEEIKVRRHSEQIAFFTVIIFVIASFMLFMIFMNFLIAVIGDTHSHVSQHYVAHDYHQRAIMIYEREIHFTQDDFKNVKYFPNIIVVKKKKKTGQINQSIFSQITQLKTYIKNQNNSILDQVLLKQKEQKDIMTNQIKLLEKEILSVHSYVKNIETEMTKNDENFPSSYQRQKSTVVFKEKSSISRQEFQRQSTTTFYPIQSKLESRKQSVDKDKELKEIIEKNFGQFHKMLEKISCENQELRQEIQGLKVAQEASHKVQQQGFMDVPEISKFRKPRPSNLKPLSIMSRLVSSDSLGSKYYDNLKLLGKTRYPSPPKTGVNSSRFKNDIQNIIYKTQQLD